MNTTALSVQDIHFLQEFQVACDRYVATYLNNSDPDDPASIFFSSVFEFDRLEEMGRKYAHVATGLRNSEEGYRHLWKPMQVIVKRAEHVMKEYFQQVGYDYAGIATPPALPVIPGVDWNKPIKVKYWAGENTASNYRRRKGEEWEYLETILVGQIAITTRLWDGVRSYEFYTYQGWGLGIKVSCKGCKEAKAALKTQALEIARLLNLLTDWDYDVHMARPLRVKRAIGACIQKIKREVMGE